MSDPPNCNVYLPNDVLLHIFKVVPDPHFGAWHVCRQWRHIILEYPAFWTTLDLNLRHRHQDEKAAHWLEMAGDKFISVIIHDDHWNNDDEPPDRFFDAHVVQLALFLRNTMDRWSALKIDGSLRSVDFFTHFCSGNAPNIRSLAINCSGTGHDHLTISLFIPFPNPPETDANLKVQIGGFVPRFAFFGPTITDLSIDFLNVDRKADDILFILQSCPNLVRCNLEAISDLTPAEWSMDLQAPWRLRHEHLIDLSTSHIWDIEHLLVSLEMPSLKFLSLFLFRWKDATLGALRDTFQRSPSLTIVKLMDEETDELYENVRSPVINLGQISLDSVTYFSITANPIAHTLLRHLTLPRVEEVVIHEIPFDVLHGLISSSSHLRSAALYTITDAHLSELPLISLPSLTSLTAWDSGGVHENLLVPQLHTLTLGKTEHTLRDLIDNSSPVLTTLSLARVNITDKQLVWCLQQLSYLEKLHLHGCTVSDIVLSAMTEPATTSAQPLLPRLKEIHLGEIKRITPQGVIGLLASRNGLLSSVASDIPRIEGRVKFVGQLSEPDRQALLVSHINLSFSTYILILLFACPSCMAS